MYSVHHHFHIATLSRLTLDAVTFLADLKEISLWDWY